MLTFTLESDNIGRAMESLMKYYPSMYSDFILDGNQLVTGVIVKEDIPYTITTIIKTGEDPSQYYFTIIASGGTGRSRQRELSLLESSTKEFIDNHIDFLKRRDTMVWPCNNCGASYAYPVLSADGRYRCPKCASPVDSGANQ